MWLLPYNATYRLEAARRGLRLQRQPGFPTRPAALIGGMEFGLSQVTLARVFAADHRGTLCSLHLSQGVCLFALICIK